MPENFTQLESMMPDESPYDAFLSHSAKDKAVVRPLAERLRADGVKVIPRDKGGRRKDESGFYPSSFIIHTSPTVLRMSANAFGSDWAQLGSGTFRFRDSLSKERRFLPLRLDDAPISGNSITTTRIRDQTLNDKSAFKENRSSVSKQ